jgi:uncharacterized protein involved in outer membrane biogenesis
VKAVKIGGLMILVVLVAVVVYVVVNAGDIVKQIIEDVGSDALGAPVTVRSVDLSLDGGAISGLQIGNPKGFETPYAIRVETAQIGIDTAASNEAVVVIKQVLVDGAKINAEIIGKNSNLQALMDNLGTGDAVEDESASTIKLIIDRFDFTNAQTTLLSDVIGEKAVKVPDIHLTDIGRKDSGATSSEVLKQLMQPLLNSIIREAIAGQIGIDADGIEKSIKGKLGGALKGLVGGDKDE